MPINFDYSSGEIVSSPTVIVSGNSDLATGVIGFTNNENRVFPPQYFEINNHNFKAILHVSPGENEFQVKVINNGSIDALGYARFRDGKMSEVDSATLKLNFYPLDNKPVHLCVILGRDSQGSYDMPGYRLQRGEVANLDTAIRRMKVAGRLMQAYTQNEMRSVGFSNRTFQFVEETVSQQSVFGYEVNSPTPHQEVKVHVLRSDKTVAELRDPNLAQQNPKGTNTGGLFDHAIDLIKRTPEIYNKRNQNGTAVQCAVLYLDAHYDIRNDMILCHAALGGGTGEVKLAIFGSHGLHSWPINFPAVGPSFLDQTALSKKEVANDCNQCGTSWECLNITLGAFMHEIGHSLGCPHQVDGVMLRDYIWWNRSFMSREGRCIRTNSNNAVINRDGQWPRSCHWNKLDLIRFLYHDSFTLPIDKNDPTFQKNFSTTNAPDDSYHNNQAPTLYTTPAGTNLKSGSGIYLIEMVHEDLARSHISYLPKSYGGQGVQNEVVLDYDTLWHKMRQDSQKAHPEFSVKILSLGGEVTIDNFKKSSSTGSVIKSDFGLGRGKITGYKSAMLGRDKGTREEVIGFDIKHISKIRIYHGGALDGIRFYFTTGFDSQPPPVPPRNFLSKFKSLGVSDQSSGNSVLLGNEKPHYSELNVSPNDPVVKLHFRNGAWIDAVSFEFASGKKTQMYGNAGGGHLSTLEAPGDGFTIVGMYGHTTSWLDGLGIIYSNEV